MKTYQLIINAGSSSMKYNFFEEEKGILQVYYEKISSRSFQRRINKKAVQKISKSVYENSLKDLLKLKEVSSLKLHEDLMKIGFRYVHGGKSFQKPTRVTNTVLKKLKKLDESAPLHNPHARQLVLQSMKIFPKIKKFLFFDTAFHSSIPEVNWRYGIPKALSDKNGIRRYGFHGTVCSSIIHQLKEKKKLKKKLVICHLGSGSSVTAVKNGSSIHTSMGMTPMEGLLMSTRSGDIDPGLILFLQKKYKWSASKTDEYLNRDSGLKGLAGSGDMRELLKKSKKDKQADMAIRMFCRKTAEYIAKYSVSLGGLDQVIFSGGIGENSPIIRKKILEQLLHMGVRVSDNRNTAAKALQPIHKRFSKVKLAWAHADEASEINRLLKQF
jgi:acetate kinase